MGNNRPQTRGNRGESKTKDKEISRHSNLVRLFLKWKHLVSSSGARYRHYFIL